MGKNKDRLQVNNLDLSAILSGIQNLPPAGGEDLQSTAEAQTTAVTELLKMVSRKVADHKGEGEYVWKKLTAEGGEFIDFVVSSDTEVYPNGAIHADGYWYELVEEGLNIPNLFGYTKVAVDTLTYSTDTYPSAGLKHSLGEIPQIAILIGEVDKVANSVFFGFVGSGVGDTTASYSALGFYLVYKQTIAGTVTHPSSSTVYFYDYGKTKFLKAGKKFTLITMA